MRCPACQSQSIGDETACPRCGFSIGIVDRMLGAAQPLDTPVADLSGALKAAETRRIAAVVKRIEHRYPQAQLALVVSPVPADVPLAVYIFWLFNRGRISSAVEREGDNHLVLLLIDPGEAKGGRAACMIGYGLEPLIEQSQLDQCLAHIKPELTAGDHAGAAIRFFESIEPVLHAASQMCGVETEENDEPAAATTT